MDPQTELLVRKLRGTPEATLALLSGLPAQAAAGLHGASQGITSLARGRGWSQSVNDAADRVERTQQALTFKPVTESGRTALQGTQQLIEPINEAIEKVPSKIGEYSPAAGAMTAATLAVVDPTKILGKGARAVKTAARTAPEALAGERAALASTALREAPVARSTASLAAEGLEPDVIRSIMIDPEYKPKGKDFVGPQQPATVPRAVVDTARANRAAYRQEPATLPKPATEMSPADWEAFGARHGADFSQTPMKSLGVSDLASKREIMVPGGLEGTFTIPDLFQIKANNFDPGVIGQDLHNQLMAKFLRTYERKGGGDPVDTFNDLNFALMSPNAPLTQNEFLAQRFRLKDMDELRALAARAAPRGDKEAGRALWSALDTEAGTGAASRGGLGVGGTADLGNQAELARLLLEKPEMFRPGEGETLRDVGFRVMNQVPGLSVKTASLGIPWTDLAKGNTSAVDLHMIRHNYPRLMQENPKFAAAMERLAQSPKGRGLSEEKRAIQIIGGRHPRPPYRSAKTGELHPDLPAHLQPEKLAYEPQHWTAPNEFYQQIMDYVDQSRQGAPHELFPEQWRLWDTYRGRVEPHEMAHPDWRKLPRQSFSELQDALTAHKRSGYMASPDPEVQRAPVPKQGDWRSLYYGRATPGGLAALGGASAGAALLARLLREQQPPAEEADRSLPVAP